MSTVSGRIVLRLASSNTAADRPFAAPHQRRTSGATSACRSAGRCSSSESTRALKYVSIAHSGSSGNRVGMSSTFAPCDASTRADSSTAARVSGLAGAPAPRSSSRPIRVPRTASTGGSGACGGGKGRDRQSRRSGCDRIAVISTTSATERARGPADRMLLAGVWGIRPWVGLSPTRPQKAAGMRTDPPRSLPIVKGPNPAATAAAPPDVDPPGVRARFQGFRAVPCWLLMPDARQPRSGIVVLPSRTAPASSNRAAGGASVGDGAAGA